ncbi:Putative mono-oxygenase ydhR [Acidovorax delafieldii 2AN]|uniref:Putative mono-oxygenase ydhR n=1 Tax=Acidovorax delafieldii 2AN TaxID=573060 RepID=C5T7K1_ACIDE|nr:monooxygenase [Acidovorax delafieldii]EER59557.1 Putative mono-oxygenase ydhR [Acidovorax delafieldii 2AN]
MSCILQVDFPYTGPWGPEMTAAMDGLARSIADEPGLVWKIWTENRQANEAGGIYCFKDAQSAQAYLTMHTARLKSFGIPQVNGKIFEVNESLSKIGRAPV